MSVTLFSLVTGQPLATVPVQELPYWLEACGTGQVRTSEMREATARREEAEAKMNSAYKTWSHLSSIRDFVDALNKDNEEKIKGMMMFPRQHPSFTSAL